MYNLIISYGSHKEQTFFLWLTVECKLEPLIFVTLSGMFIISKITPLT